jgi:hypothetical protein
MPVFFSLEGAKQQLGLTTTIEQCLAEREAQLQQEQLTLNQLLWEKEPETRWAKLDHLLYLPLLGLTRPRDLYYYQGPGLRVLYGFSYKYLTVEHFLGRLTRLAVGQPLAVVLAQRYSQAWYPGQEPLVIYVDWHIKPHWTKHSAHSGAVTMWGRVMPGTKQLLINGPAGHLLAGWNMAIDCHLSQVLVDLEEQLARLLARPIAYTVCDSEGGGLPLGQQYLAAQRAYLSYLSRQGYALDDFEVLGEWQAVTADPDRQVVLARWRDPLKAKTEVRELILMRRVGDVDPTRIYTGHLPTTLALADVPAAYRQRWSAQERVIRELVNGANLNANFGYRYQDVPNRTIQRHWLDAQARVEVSERKVADHHQAVQNLKQQAATLRQVYHQHRQSLSQTWHQLQTEFSARQAAGQPLRRCQQRLTRTQAQLNTLKARYHRRRHKLLAQLRQHRHQYNQASTELSQRQQQRDALDTTSLCRERDLEKDQIMLNLQLLLGNLHHWVRDHYLAPEWQQLELKTATELIYRKSGWVHWRATEIEVVLEPYRYPEHQQAMVETCRRFNAANVHWRDGRLLRIRVTPAS